MVCSMESNGGTCSLSKRRAWQGASILKMAASSTAYERTATHISRPLNASLACSRKHERLWGVFAIHSKLLPTTCCPFNTPSKYPTAAARESAPLLIPACMLQSQVLLALCFLATRVKPGHPAFTNAFSCSGYWVGRMKATIQIGAGS